MRRLIFCFDGTWNSLGGVPTNVVLTAASIKPRSHDNISQVIYYDEGVGTAWYDKWIGGGLGWGLIENVREAYRFLIFNYEPGDEIFVFGFSRGAFTARSFVGLMKYVGPIRRLHASHIDEALTLYHKRVKDADQASEPLKDFRARYSSDVCISAEDDEWRATHDPTYIRGSAPILKVKYLGVWDTVSALGVPEALPGSDKMNVGYRFHDPSVSDFIENARHAVAIDERRVLYPSVPFGDLTALNKSRGFEPDDKNAPYQERWFPGVHGSVGGGGDYRGLSDGALAWILNGAKKAGLELDSAAGSRIQTIAPNPLAPLVNAKKPSTFILYRWVADRKGPARIWQVSDSVLRRWKAHADKVPERKLYRPKTLSAVASALDACEEPSISETIDVIANHVVVPGDTLSGLAYKYYRHANDANIATIFDANRDTLDDPNDLYVGWTVRIPRLAEQKS